MAKIFVTKKSHDTTWRTKSESIFKKKKLLSGESDLTVSCFKSSFLPKPHLWFDGPFLADMSLRSKKMINWILFLRTVVMIVFMQRMTNNPALLLLMKAGLISFLLTS
jgi:hypothetical protein